MAVSRRSISPTYYSETLIELERVISEASTFVPVVVTGDFNAHPGDMASPNNQRIVLALSIPITLILPLPLLTTFLATSRPPAVCWTHEEYELNTSDHLPISAKLSGIVEKHDPSWIKVDWTKAIKSG